MRLKLIILVGLLIVVVPSLQTWFGYNSALSRADTEAVEWLNSLENSTYGVSSEVAPWIYGRYLEKEYEEEGGTDFYIWRSKPMTPRCDPNNVYYNRGNVTVEYDRMELLKVFTDGEVEVRVYGEGGL